MEDLKPFGDVLSKLITALEFVAWVLRRLVWFCGIRFTSTRP